MHLQSLLVREAALSGNEAAASFLCNTLDQPNAPVWNTTDAPHLSLGDHIHPDIRGAVYAVAAAQPAGCTLASGSHCALSSQEFLSATALSFGDWPAAVDCRVALWLNLLPDSVVLPSKPLSGRLRPVLFGDLTSMPDAMLSPAAHASLLQWYELCTH